MTNWERSSCVPCRQGEISPKVQPDRCKSLWWKAVKTDFRFLSTIWPKVQGKIPATIMARLVWTGSHFGEIKKTLDMLATQDIYYFDSENYKPILHNINNS